jgi:hypothetical protein
VEHQPDRRVNPAISALGRLQQAWHAGGGAAGDEARLLAMRMVPQQR